MIKIYIIKLKSNYKIDFKKLLIIKVKLIKREKIFIYNQVNINL